MENNNFDIWLIEVLSNKKVVDKLLKMKIGDAKDWLSRITPLERDNIKICAEILGRRNKKYLIIANLIDYYQAEIGDRPKFRR